MINQETFIYPLSKIEDSYGKDNIDDFGDEFIYQLNLVSDYEEQFKAKFQFSITHDNPFYHNLIVKVPGVTSKKAEVIRKNINIKEREQNDRYTIEDK